VLVASFVNKIVPRNDTTTILQNITVTLQDLQPGRPVFFILVVNVGEGGDKGVDDNGDDSIKCDDDDVSDDRELLLAGVIIIMVSSLV
jgi:hypothetical protein